MARKNTAAPATPAVETLELHAPHVKYATVSIVGDNDLILNRMNARAERVLIRQREDKAKLNEVPNIWEDIITAIHWRDGIPVEDTYRDCSEELLRRMLIENAPCISAFGLKESWKQAVTRNEIDKFSVKFAAAVNVLGHGDLVPIKFAAHYVDKKLMSPKKGAPVLCHMNRFSGWSADIDISYMDSVYSLEQIVNIINLSGFGIGIGSGRKTYGKYHVIQVTPNGGFNG